MPAGVEERNELPGDFVTASDVGSLVRIAVYAAQGEIAGFGWATMMSGNDMIDFKWNGVVNLANAAIFTRRTCTVPYQFGKGFFHERGESFLFPGQSLQCSSGLRMQDSQKTAGVGVAVKFLSLCHGKRACLVADGQLMHPSFVFRTETELEQVTSQRGSKSTSICQNPAQDGNCVYRWLCPPGSGHFLFTSGSMITYFANTHHFP
jgi:hypothetical protein